MEGENSYPLFYESPFATTLLQLLINRDVIAKEMLH